MADNPMPAADLVLQALHGIRADLKRMHELQGATNERLDTAIDRLDRVEAEVSNLGRRTTEGFLQTNTKIAELSKAVGTLAQRVDDHDRRLDHLLTKGLGGEVREFKVRITRVESALVARSKKTKP